MTEGQQIRDGGWRVTRWGECRQGSFHLLHSFGRDDPVHLTRHTISFLLKIKSNSLRARKTSEIGHLSEQPQTRRPTTPFPPTPIRGQTLRGAFDKATVSLHQTNVWTLVCHVWEWHISPLAGVGVLPWNRLPALACTHWGTAPALRLPLLGPITIGNSQPPAQPPFFSRGLCLSTSGQSPREGAQSVVLAGQQTSCCGPCGSKSLGLS